MKGAPFECREYLTPDEAADQLRVHPRTVARWDRSGKFAGFGDGAVIRTLGGRRRFAADVITAIARGEQP